MIDLTVYGDPGACRAAAREGRTVARAVSRAPQRLAAATCDSWTGPAGEGYRDTISDLRGALGDLEDRITPSVEALETFAGELDVVRSRLASVRSTAASAGLSISGDVIQPPADLTGADLTPAQVDAHDAKVTAYNTAFAAAEDARTKESEAHEHLVSAMTASNGDGWLENLLEKLGLAPPDGMDSVTGAGYLLGLGGLGFGGLAGWMSKGALGIWQPKFLNTQGAWVWGSNQGWSPLQRLGLSLRNGAAARDFRPLPYQAGNVGRWQTAGKWAGRAGTAVTAVTSAWTQWQSDSDDPSLDTGERVDRAATTGASTAAGAWAGAEGGAWVGGAIGTAICPGAGTVIGGAVGGLVGGAVGAYAGSELAGVVNEQWDGAVHAVGDGIDAAGDALGDAADATGDALGDAADAVTFWD